MLVAKITDVDGGGHDGSSRSSQQTWENGGRVGGRPVLAWTHGPLQCTSPGLLVTPCTTPSASCDSYSGQCDNISHDFTIWRARQANFAELFGLLHRARLKARSDDDFKGPGRGCVAERGTFAAFCYPLEHPPWLRLLLVRKASLHVCSKSL